MAANSNRKGSLAFFLLTLLVFLALFVFRSVDDNRLTSWHWVFDVVDASRVYLLLSGGILLAWLFSRFPLPGPKVIFILSFALAALFWREPEVIVDASRYFTQAKHLEIYGTGYFFKQWGGDIGAWTDLPAVPFLYGLIFKFIGESRVYIQIFTTVMFSLTVVLTALIGRELWDDTVGQAAGVLLLGIPYLFTQVPLMLVDVPSMFFLTLSVFTYIRALRRGGLMIVLSALAIFFSFFSKYSMWLMLSVLAVLFLVQMRESPAVVKRVLVRGLLIILVSGILIGTVLLYKYGVVSEQIRLLISYQRPGLRRWTESFTSTFLFQVHPLITAAALYSIYAGLRKKDLRYVIIVWLPLLMVLMQIKRIRYIVPVFPMLALMASYGLREIRTEELKKFVVLSIAFSSLVIAVFAYRPFLERVSTVNLKNAGEYLDSLDETVVEVFTLPQKSSVNPAVSVPLLDLFTGKKLLYNYEPTAAPPLDKVRVSSLRFTWQYKNPRYYECGDSREGAALAVISGKPEGSLPLHIGQETGGYRASRVFKTCEGVFRFRTFVTVYREGSYNPFRNKELR